MKRLVATLATVVLLLGTSAGVASAAARNVPVQSASVTATKGEPKAVAAPVTPGVTTVHGVFTDPSCPGVYTSKTTVSKWGVSVNLSADTTNDLVYVNQGGSLVKTGSGNDCVVVAAGANGGLVQTNAGADVINANSTGNDLEGGAGADVINSNATGDYLVGGAGTDTCNYDYMTSYAVQCEL